MAEIILVSKSLAADPALDDSVMIQAALDGVAARGGGVVRLTSGMYFLGPPGGTATGTDEYSLKISSNTLLLLDPDAVLVRRFKGGGVSQATIVNKGGAAGNDENIGVSGGTITTEGNADNFIGKHLGFVNVRTLRVHNVRFPKVYAAWTAFFRDCQDVTISSLVIGNRESLDDQLQDDGLHFAGGTRIAVVNSLIYCGDDCIALVHEGTSTSAPDARPQTNLSDLVVSNCTLWTVRAHPIRVQVTSNYDGDKTISKVRISNIVAKAGFGLGDDGSSSGIRIADQKAGVRLISDISIDGVTLDCSQNSIADFAGFPLVIYGVDRVQLSNVRIMRPSKHVTIDDGNDTELRDCSVDWPRQLGYGSITVATSADCSNIRILGGWYNKARGHSIQLGAPGDPGFKVDKFQIIGARIADSALNGVLIANGFNGVIVGNTITGSIGPGSAWGIQETHLSDENVILSNQLLSNASGPVSFVGLNTEVARNFGGATVNILDSGGYRQTIDGWTHEGTSIPLTNFFAEISRNNFIVAGGAGAGRFRAVRPGSVTGVVITSDLPQTQGTLTAHVYKNVGVAGYGGGPIGVSAVLTNGLARAAFTQAKNLDFFAAGDELYIVLQTSNSPPTGNNWLPTDARIRCAIEIED